MAYVKCCHSRAVRIDDLIDAGLLQPARTLVGATQILRGVVPFAHRKARITERGPSVLAKFMAGHFQEELALPQRVLWQDGCPYCDGDGWLWKNEGGEQ